MQTLETWFVAGDSPGVAEACAGRWKVTHLEMSVSHCPRAEIPLLVTVALGMLTLLLKPLCPGSAGTMTPSGGYENGFLVLLGPVLAHCLHLWGSVYGHLVLKGFQTQVGNVKKKKKAVTKPR